MRALTTAVVALSPATVPARLTGSDGVAGLPQSQKAGDEEHYHHNTNDVENTVHVGVSFLPLSISNDACGQVNGQRALPAPTRISPAPTTEQKQHYKNDQ